MALETKKRRKYNNRTGFQCKTSKMVKVKQLLDHSHIDVNEIPGIVRSELDREELRARIKPGASVAITCGSRGVANIAVIIRAIVDFVRNAAEVPSYSRLWEVMRSHCPGQREILASYHVGRETLWRCPIKATMEVVQVGETPDGMPVYETDTHRRLTPSYYADV